MPSPLHGVTLREPGLPAVRTGDAEEDLKLLVDLRDQLWRERTRVANRLHADLSIAYPGYQRTVGRTPHEPVVARS